MSFGGFLITCPSPDALAAFRLAPPGAFGGPLQGHLCPASRSKNPRPFRARNTAFIELISGVSLLYAARRQWVSVFIFAFALLLLTEGLLVRIQPGGQLLPIFQMPKPTFISRELGTFGTCHGRVNHPIRFTLGARIRSESQSSQGLPEH